ncbi:MAG: sulfotransferase, partial [Rhodospirillales bacterium]|nr:sulfotransferase [Rhodospirillales bacterium]
PGLAVHRPTFDADSGAKHLHRGETAMRLPDFIIGGAPRSGTTWLYALADRHPGIAMARPVKPEPKFFLVDELHARGLEHYSATWFASLPAGMVAGEKSTNYLENPVVAERLHAALPTVKLVFCLRDPVTRAWSNYRWSRQNGMESEDFLTALDREEERERNVSERLRHARPHAYFSRGLYADMLEPFLRRFPRRQVLVLKYEDFASAPADIARRLHAFLGVDERPEDAAGLAVINPSEGGDPLPTAAAALLIERYRQPNRKLTTLLGSDFQLWPEPR